MDWNTLTRESLYNLMRQWWCLSAPGNDAGLITDYCPFVEAGSTAVRWDGAVSPCLPLMHNHTVYVEEREHFSRHYAVGQVSERGLDEIWRAPEYTAFREKVQTFHFAPCLSCGGCEMFEKNEEDCIGNTFPTCGGCLWAQGLIRCP
jgi:MoaA/NifB/PqqE/SkfB family radical SAM enzyme